MRGMADSPIRIEARRCVCLCVSFMTRACALSNVCVAWLECVPVCVHPRRKCVDGGHVCVEECMALMRGSHMTCEEVKRNL